MYLSLIETCYLLEKGRGTITIIKAANYLIPIGGTGWAVELAKLFNRPLHVYDQTRRGWFTWKEGAWHEDTPLIRYSTFVGSGTRYLNDDGVAAMAKLFADSFKQG